MLHGAGRENTVVALQISPLVCVYASERIKRALTSLGGGHKVPAVPPHSNTQLRLFTDLGPIKPKWCFHNKEHISV